MEGSRLTQLTHIMFDPPVITTGIILSSPQPKIYYVELANGKKIIGHVAKAMQHLHESLKSNVRVTLEMTPYDFEKGRISAILDSES